MSKLMAFQQGLQALLGLGQAAGSMFIDYPNAQRAAEESKARQQDAIWQTQQHAGSLLDRYIGQNQKGYWATNSKTGEKLWSDDLANRVNDPSFNLGDWNIQAGERWQPGMLQQSRDSQLADVERTKGEVLGNYAKFWEDWQKNNLESQARKLGAEHVGAVRDEAYNDRFQTAWDSFQSDRNTVGYEMDRLKSLFAATRDEAQQALGDTNRRLTGLDAEYRRKDEELEQTADLAGMKANREEVRNLLLNERGQYEAASLATSVLTQRDDALRQLEVARQSGQIDDRQYRAQRQSIIDQAGSQVRDTTRQVAAQKTSEWVKAEVDLDAHLSAVKNSLIGGKTGLFNSWAGGQSQLSADRASLVNGLLGSVGQEADAIQELLSSQLEASKGMAWLYGHASGLMAGAISEASQAIWQAIGDDSRMKAHVTLDGPNQMLMAATASRQAIESEYIGNVLTVQNMADVFTQLGINMNYQFSPVFASISDYTSRAMDGLTNALNTSLAIQANDRANRQVALAEKMAPWNVAMGGVNAASNLAAGFGDLGWKPFAGKPTGTTGTTGKT